MISPLTRPYSSKCGGTKIAPGFVARRQHDAARMLAGIRADDDRLTFQFRILPDLHGGIERVHVHMKDDARSGFRRHGLSSWTGPGIKSFAAGEGESLGGSEPEERPGGVGQVAEKERREDRGQH